MYKKLFILCLLLLIVPIKVNGTESPTTLSVSNNYEFYEGYKLLKNMPSFSSKLTTNGDYLYCLTYHVEAPNGQTVTRGIELTNPGYIYLAQYGFPNKSITGDNSKDYYITQIAYWWYVDYLNGISDDTDGNLPAKLKSNFTSEYGDTDIINGINSLVNGAKSATDTNSYLTIDQISNQGMGLNKDGTYYESDPIYVNASTDIENYTVSFISNDVGAIITDRNGNEKNTFSRGEVFIVKVPEPNMTQTASISVRVASDVIDYHSYQYDASEPTKYQSLTYSILGSTINTLADSTVIMGTIQTATLVIDKIDDDTEEYLNGARFELYNNEALTGKPVVSFTTFGEPYIISHLRNGTYFLKEISAPKGYYTNKKITTISLVSNKTKTVYVENTKTVVRISKLDIADKEELVGAHLQILDTNGKVIEEWDSDGKEHIINGLPIGKYKLKETKAPEGYEKETETVSFEIADNGKPTEVIMYNIVKTDVPNTGMSNSNIIYIIGIIFIIGSSVIAYSYVKKA